MESVTKNRQSPESLCRLIERAYGSDQVPIDDDAFEEFEEGWFNAVYRVRLRDGGQRVLKLAPPGNVEVMTYEREMMRNELAAIRLIEEQTTVPVPRVDFVDTSHDLIGADWFAMAYIDADNAGVVEEQGRYSEQESASLHEQLGALNRELNAIIGPHFGPLHGPGAASWSEAFTTMFEDALGDAERAGVHLGWTYDEFRTVLTEHASSLDEVTEPRFVEWDLWLKNAMALDGRIVALIDHERAFYGDPLIEAGFMTAGLPELGDAEAFLRGYGRGPLTEVEHERRLLYTLYLFMVMAIETSYRGHEDPAQYDIAMAMVTILMRRYGRTP